MGSSHIAQITQKSKVYGNLASEAGFLASNVFHVNPRNKFNLGIRKLPGICDTIHQLI